MFAAISVCVIPVCCRGMDFSFRYALGVLESACLLILDHILVLHASQSRINRTVLMVVVMVTVVPQLSRGFALIEHRRMLTDGKDRGHTAVTRSYRPHFAVFALWTWRALRLLAWAWGRLQRPCSAR